jgi:NAD(P)H dehydrogenase (quinone)
MPKVLVLFHSRTGNTAMLADAIAEGAASVKFSEVDVRRIADLEPERALPTDDESLKSREALTRKYKTLESPERVAEYDALILGSPRRDGVMSAELKTVLDRTSALVARGAFADKVGSAFSTMVPHGGHEMTIHSILTSMIHFGMIIVPPSYADPVMFTAGGPNGAMATTGSAPPTEAELDVARHQGKRVAKVTEWIRHARSHDARSEL